MKSLSRLTHRTQKLELPQRTYVEALKEYFTQKMSFCTSVTPCYTDFVKKNGFAFFSYASTVKEESKIWENY